MLVLPNTTKLLLYPALALLVGLLHVQFTKHLDYPFIDEFFHVRQCKTYCEGRYSHWDNKITTPPGLYLLGVAYTKMIALVTGGSPCADLSILRSLNLVGLVVLGLAVRKLRIPGDAWTINILIQPILFTYFFLFYTDVWSTALIVGSLAFARHKRPFLSALAGFASLWLRQTNIVWLAFVASVYVDQGLRSHGTRRIYDLLMRALRNWSGLVPYLAVFASFAIFLKVNGGITFGDKENHQVQAHLVQVFYCFTFINFFTLPVWLNTKTMRSYLTFYMKYAVFNVPAYFAIKIIIENFTIVHKFLLADNRHFTFYIYRRLLSSEWSHILAIPVYHFCTWNVVHLLMKGRLSFITVVSYLVAVILTLVPSPLFEPRYYIVPLVMFRLHVAGRAHYRETAWLAAINAFTMAVFFGYSFTWESEKHPQRIIW